MMGGIADNGIISKKSCNILLGAPDFKYKILGDIYGWKSIYTRSKVGS